MSEVKKSFEEFWNKHKQREDAHIELEKWVEGTFKKNNFYCGTIVADEQGFEVYFPRMDLSIDDITSLNNMFEEFCLKEIHSVSDAFRLYFKLRKLKE